MMFAPCKNCSDRRPHCHSCCEKYIAFSKQCENVRERKYLENQADAVAVDYIMRIKKWRRTHYRRHK